MKELETPEDFLGHIGGDDFVILSVPGRAEELCRRIIAGFDERIGKYYTEEDRKQGFFVGKDRKGIEQTFPLISVTIAIVTDDGSRFRSPLDMAEAAAQFKEYAKTLPGSNYVTEKDVTEEMNRLRTTLLRMVALLFLAGCAQRRRRIEKTEVVTSPARQRPPRSTVTPPRLTEDRDLFAEGLALLNQPDRPDPAKARAVFASLLERYPQSRWRSAAETFIRLIDETTRGGPARPAWRNISWRNSSGRSGPWRCRRTKPCKKSFGS